MGFDVLSYAIGLQAGKKAGGSSETVIFAEQTLSFAYSEIFGAFKKEFEPSPFSLVAGQEYIIVWDGIENKRTAFAFTNPIDSSSCVALGNPLVAGGEANEDNFAIVEDKTGGFAHFFSTETTAAHTVKIYQEAESGGVINGVDPYYQKLAETMVTRRAGYVSGDETTMSLKGFVTSNGSTLGNIQSYTYAGFGELVSIELSDTVIISENAFVGDKNLKIIDITVPNIAEFAQTAFMEGSLNGCSALESIIVRPSASGLTAASIAANHGSNDTFYVYIPAEYYETVIANRPNGTFPASRYRKLEDYPEVDNWKGA